MATQNRARSDNIEEPDLKGRIYIYYRCNTVLRDITRFYQKVEYLSLGKYTAC